MTATETTWTPEYERWRHGGWYVTNVTYPSGAVGCVSNNYPDRKWRIACGRPESETYPSRDAAARAEREIARRERLNAAAPKLLAVLRRLVRRLDNGDTIEPDWYEADEARRVLEEIDPATLTTTAA
jgi:hypothetical protein